MRTGSIHGADAERFMSECERMRVRELEMERKREEGLKDGITLQDAFFFPQSRMSHSPQTNYFHALNVKRVVSHTPSPHTHTHTHTHT